LKGFEGIEDVNEFLKNKGFLLNGFGMPEESFSAGLLQVRLIRYLKARIFT
jgi:hypothetical protein